MMPNAFIRRGESFRLTVHDSNVARIENCFVSPSKPPPSGYETAYQIVLPYHGLFSYFAGRRGWLIDPTRTLCISPGWEFNEDKPVPGTGHAAILLNPSIEVVEEACGARPADRHPAFLHASLPSNRQLRLLTHQLMRHPASMQDALRIDELVVLALSQLQPPRSSRARASKVVARAKEVLHAYGGERLSLQEVATMVGVSPVYLTQEFTRSEGLPLYQYELELRLNRALLELPDCTSITELALDLGFSSHSHFTSAFRKAFAMTPSKYRSGLSSVGLQSTDGSCGAKAVTPAEHRRAA